MNKMTNERVLENLEQQQKLYDEGAEMYNALEVAMKLVRADQLNEEKVMVQRIGFPAMLEQLAEEASELAQAALKVARITRGENPTPVSIEEGVRYLKEEYTDVIQCATELGIKVNADQIRAKRKRFLGRWEEFREEKRKRKQYSDIPPVSLL